jgi:hypothetical protein
VFQCRELSPCDLRHALAVKLRAEEGASRLEVCVGGKPFALEREISQGPRVIAPILRRKGK